MENLIAAILERLLRIGDEVIMKMDNEARNWGRKGVPDGTKGVVIGFHRYVTYVGRNSQEFSKPGVYEGNGACIVKWEDGTTDRPSASDLYVDTISHEQRQKDNNYKEAFDAKERLSDLPVTKYIEGNVVLATDGIEYYINTVDYRNIDYVYEDGSKNYPIYQVRPMSGPQYTTSIPEEAIVKLIDAGNYWAWENNKSLLKFKDLNEEGSFYRSLGFSEQLRNPATGNYGWTIEEALAAIKAGTADVISTSGSLFGSRPFPTVYRFPRLPELGDRLRAETLKGFADML